MITYWLFLSNVVHCILKQKYEYAIAFLLLTLTSFLVWSYVSNRRSFWADQVAIYTVVLIGGFYSTKIKNTGIFCTAVASVILVGLIHAVGLVLGTDEYHHLVHVLSVFGHHVILLGN
jgi:hypothetical protein